MVTVFCIVLLGAISLNSLQPKIVSHFICYFLLPFLVLLPARPYHLDDKFLLYLLPYYIALLAFGFLSLWQLATKLHGILGRVGLRVLCVVLGVTVLSIWSVHAWSAIPKRDIGRRLAPLKWMQPQRQGCVQSASAARDSNTMQKRYSSPRTGSNLEHL